MKKPKCYSYLRFSTPKQVEGDSIRRQIKAAEKYAESKGLELDQSLRDEGLSGFSGSNIKYGNLGKFLALIENGEIAKDSYLIVESIDRLGRQQPFAATEVIRKILEAGITLVVTDWLEPMEYTLKSITHNPGEFSGLGREIERAYFESLKKAKNLKEAWVGKRLAAIEGKKKLTKMAPFWLELSPDRTEFKILEDQANAVRKVYELKSIAYGNNRIADVLNNDPKIWKPSPSKRNKTGGWATSTIQRIANDPRVIGEFQMFRKVDGKRVIEGEPIKNYYPPIIEKESFYHVRSLMRKWKEEHGHNGGRRKEGKNLFTKLAVCGNCGSPMHFIDKGNTSKGGKYLHCALSREPKRAKNGEKCKEGRIHYEHFKENFFAFTSELSLTDILPSNDEHQSKINDLVKKIDSNGEKLISLAKQENNLLDSISVENNPKIRKIFRDRLDKNSSEIDFLNTETRRMTQECNDLKHQSRNMQKQLDTLTEIQKLETLANSKEERKEFRLKLHGAIKRLINKIEIYSSPPSPGRYNMIKVWFHGSHPYARLIIFDEKGWRQLTRNKRLKSM